MWCQTEDLHQGAQETLCCFLGRAYVSLNPRLKGTSIRLRAKVGAFSEAYGAANKYSTDNEAVASQHGAYLIGRIRTIGEVVKVEIPYKAFTLALDHGFGANRPDPSVWNPSRFSLVHHAHAVVRYRNIVEVGGHYVNSWAQEDLRPTDPANPDHWQDDEFSADYPDGKLSVYGADARLRLGRGGYYYGGYSYVLAQNVGVVGQAVEVIHATGGGQYNVGIKGNYLDGPEANSNGNGAIHTVMIEGEHSIRTLLEGDDYWGQKRDLGVKFYAMLNQVRSDDEFIDGQWKFKWGTDLVFNALPWLQVATRYDRLQPDHRIPEQSFSILSPRLVFRTNWITNEYITLQYSRYFYNARTCPNGNDPGTPGHGQYCVQPPSGPIQPDGFGITRNNTDAEWRGVSSNIPDQSVVTIQATMWW